MNEPAPTAENDGICARLGAISTADAADGLRRLGVKRTVMRGIRPLVAPGQTIAGRARTLRMLPEREDIKKPVNGPTNRGLYDSIEAGEVLVVDAMALESHAVLGDMMLTRIMTRGAAAVVVDGAVRDIPVMLDKGLPIFARGSSPDVFLTRLRPWEADCAIQCGGVLVERGDFILADADGVVVVPPALAEALADATNARRDDDAFSHALLSAGFPLDDAYPLPAYMRRFLPRFRDAGILPSPDDVRRETC